jgi:ribosomal-protein-alanine N-acetyltransferase
MLPKHMVRATAYDKLTSRAHTILAVKKARVRIRHPKATDCASFLKMVRLSRKLHRPWVYPPDSREKFLRFVKKARDGRNESFLVCLKDGGAIVGVISLNEIIHGALEGAFIGYYGAAGHENQGYISKGLSLVLRHAFRKLGLHRLEANIQPDNTRSLALAKRCGFRLEGFSPRYLKIGGRWRDHERWAITYENWLKEQR